MTFVDGFLVLGAGTRLAQPCAALDEARVVPLFAAAHGRPISPSAVGFVLISEPDAVIERLIVRGQSEAPHR
jgi:hypothetical protein